MAVCYFKKKIKLVKINKNYGGDAMDVISIVYLSLGMHYIVLAIMLI